MSHKKKDFKLVAPSPFRGVAPATSLSATLRNLINGLFGTKGPYQPTPQQIADYYLTPREREIAYLAALGFSVQEIADALGINFQTVRQHLRSVLTKMQLDEVRELRDFISRDASDRTSF